MRLSELLFNFSGRINRAQFWLGLVVLALATAATAALILPFQGTVGASRAD